MKPLRVAMTYELVESYDLFSEMNVYDCNFNEGYLKESVE